jgi:spermidine/putrescine transport system ATP-binding protein
MTNIVFSVLNIYPGKSKLTSWFDAVNAPSTGIQGEPMTKAAINTGSVGKPLISVQKVAKSFGVGQNAMIALRSVSLDIVRNEFFTLLGPSGCGKTTLLRLIAGFEHPSEGRIQLDGVDLTFEPPNQRPVNTVFQSYALFQHMTVWENVAFGLRRLRVSSEKIRERVDAMLELVKLSAMAQRLPSQLSGGQQQRVALARALAPAPRVLLLDEPLSALDLKLRREMQIELKRIQRETGIAFVLVTHDQEEALSMSDRIAVMSAGRVLQVGTPQQIYNQPKTRFVADFVGEANVLPGVLVGSSLAHVAIRPERVVLSESSRQDAPLQAYVEGLNYLGANVVVQLRLESDIRITAVTRDITKGMHVGETVYCGFPQNWHLPLED